MRSHRHQRLARREILSGVAAFALAQLLLTVGIQLWWTEVRDPAFACRLARIRERTRGTDRPLNVMMIGSSRVFLGFRPASLEAGLRQALGRPAAIFNVGTMTAGPVMNLLHLRRLERQGCRPDYLFIEVAPCHLCAMGGWDTHSMGALPLRRREVDTINHYDASPSTLRRDWWQAALLPCYAHRVGILRCFSRRLVDPAERMDWTRVVDCCGTAPMGNMQVTEENRRRWMADARRDHYPVLRHFCLGGPSCQALEDLLGHCQRYHIPTALVWMPEGPVCRSWYRPGALDEIHTFLTTLSARYDAPLIDTHEWMQEMDFADSHHLLPEGAAKFTDRFGHEALIPLVQSHFTGLARSQAPVTLTARRKSPPDRPPGQ